MFPTKWAGALAFVVVPALFLGCESTKGHEPGLDAANTIVTLEGGSYEARNFGPFSPSGAVYFMDGSSGATVRVLSTGKEISFEFTDVSTSIAASAPQTNTEEVVAKGVFLPVPAPLRPLAFYPENAPQRYHRNATLHLMQVISMNMRSADGQAALLIGLPYAEKYPETFFNAQIFDEGHDASSYGVVQSLVAGGRPADGYPARSFFGIYHILETPFGTFFNKKATQMELQPDSRGRLARALPPLPFRYELINGPIPLYRIDDPMGASVAEITVVHHASNSGAVRFSQESWPVHLPDLDAIEAKAKKVR